MPLVVNCPTIPLFCGFAGAEQDRRADPCGEFLAGLHADPVCRLLGQPGLGVADMPPVNQRVGDTIGDHVRTGDHDLTVYDWQQHLDFADRHFGRGPAKPSSSKPVPGGA